MQNLREKCAVWALDGLLFSSAITLAILSSLVSSAFAEGKQEAETALPTSTVVRAINAAVAAKAGDVAEVEMETKDNKTCVAVEIIGTDLKTYKVRIDAGSGQVMFVEAEERKATRSQTAKAMTER